MRTENGNNTIGPRIPWYCRLWFIVFLCLSILILIYILIILSLTIQVKKNFFAPKAGSSFSQNDDLFKDIAFSNNMSRAAQSDLAQLSGQKNGKILTEDDPFFGVRDAALVIVAFEDFECPFCEEAFPTIRRILSEYQDKIYFVYRDFPIISIHPHAQKAAEAAECASEQDRFWPYHDKLYQNRERLTDEYLTLYAKQIGLNMEKFKQCFDGRLFTDEVQGDYRDGVAAGVRGTPTFFINGYKIEGVIPYDIFKEVIQRAGG